jgi:flagellum-specific peptidoglycan hydrolase FlgJ
MKYTHLFALAIVALLLIPTYAAAQNATTTGTASVVPATKNPAEVCTKATERIESRITKFSDNNATHTIRLDKSIDALRTISQKLQARNINTTLLDGQISSLVDKKTKLESDKQAFVAKLQESKQFVCAASQGQFKNKIVEAKAAQAIVIADIKDTHSFVKTIRDTLKSLRGTVASSTTAVL